MKKISAKDIRTGIKYGMTVQDFCDKYRCTEDQFRTAIERVYTQKKTSAKIWNDILANGKKPRKSTFSEDDIPCDDSEPTDPRDEFYDMSHEILEVPSRKDELKKLEEKISVASDSLVKLELERKALMSSNHELRTKMRKLEGRIDKLLADINARYGEFNALATECEENTRKQIELRDSINLLRNQLEEDRKAAEQLRVLEICLYRDGHFEIPDDYDGIELYKLDATQVATETFEALLHHDDCSNFTVAEIRNLAKLLQFATESELKVEVTCDNDALETAFVRFNAEFPGRQKTAAGTAYHSSEKLPRPR